MKARRRVLLLESGETQIFADLILDLTIPKDQEVIAEALGSSKQERENLLGQKMQELMDLLGNTDEV